MYSRILVPIEPSHGEVGDRLLALAKRLVAPDGQVTLVSIIEPIPNYISGYIRDETFQNQLKANRDESLQHLEALIARAGINGKALLDEGSPSSEILRIAEKMDADAIILGSHRPDYRDYLIGSTAARVVRHAQCTVIVERSSQINL